jgi:flavin reductase (DIM6/NTAB) family NADH-FMN oxidoreductase RutF
MVAERDLPEEDRIDPRQLRNALGRFATGVAIVTTRSANGMPIRPTC